MLGWLLPGVAFYAFLALVPLLGATVLTYGLVADPQTVAKNVQSLASVMPRDAAKLIGEQLMSVVQTSGGKKGLGLLLAIAIAIFGARNAAGSITALNIAYEEEETRGFLKVNLLALAITACAVLVAVFAMLAITGGYYERLFPSAPGFVLALGKVASYALLLAGAAAAAATLYRYGPDRKRARWVWITPGTVFAAVAWLLLTFGFGFYVAHFGNYNKTYGSLATVVILVTWLYLSAYVFLFGAELNSELEHQTARIRRPAEKPIGQRDAWSADHVAGSDEPSKPSVSDVSPPQAMSQHSHCRPILRSLHGSRTMRRRAQQTARLGWRASRKSGWPLPPFRPSAFPCCGERTRPRRRGAGRQRRWDLAAQA